MKTARPRITRHSQRYWPRFSRVADRLKQYALLVRLHRPIGTFLLLWPTLWALWIAADGTPDPWVLFVFVTGVVLMRSAGCAINDFADRHIDPLVARTRSRPLASGKVSAAEAIAVFSVLAVTAFALVLTLNTLTIALSVGGIVLAASYPFMKRFHYLPQIHLGAAFGWAVPMAFTAQTGEFPSSVAWLLFITTVLWATAYDTMYAMADRDEDITIGVKSTAILFGEADRLIIGFLQTLLFLALLLVAHKVQLGGYFYLGIGAAVGFALYQQKLLATRVPANCFRAFLNNNYFGMSIFLGLVLNYLL